MTVLVLKKKYGVKTSGMKFKPLVFHAAVMEPDLVQGQMRQEECGNMTGPW